MTPSHRTWSRHQTRRDFLKDSALVAASLAATGPALAAPNPTSPSGLLLPPLLTRPTGNSIRITALNYEKPAEALVELRKEGATDWKRPQPALKAEGYTMF